MRYKKSQLISSDKRNAAIDMGKAAFIAGKRCIPNMDMANISTLADGTFETINQVMDCWISGWHRANVAQPVVFSE